MTEWRPGWLQDQTQKCIDTLNSLPPVIRAALNGDTAPSWQQRAEKAEATVARIRDARRTMGGQFGHCEWGCTDDIDEALGDAS